jgi:hypothetical protein
MIIVTAFHVFSMIGIDAIEEHPIVQIDSRGIILLTKQELLNL